MKKLLFISVLFASCNNFSSSDEERKDKQVSDMSIKMSPPATASDEMDGSRSVMSVLLQKKPGKKSPPLKLHRTIPASRL